MALYEGRFSVVRTKQMSLYLPADIRDEGGLDAIRDCSRRKLLDDWWEPCKQLVRPDPRQDSEDGLDHGNGFFREVTHETGEEVASQLGAFSLYDWSDGCSVYGEAGRRRLSLVPAGETMRMLST